MSSKISEFTEATTLGDDDMFVIVQDSSGENRRISKENLKTAIDGYTKYVALLTQTGTDAPVATVLENTLGGTVIWSRSSAGIYLGTLTGAFTLNKTVIPPFNYDSGGDAQIYMPVGQGAIDGYYVIQRFSADAVRIEMVETGYTPIEWSSLFPINGILVEIRVYP